MKIDFSDLGVKVRGNTATFKLYLPGLDPDSRVLAVGSFSDWEAERSVSLKYDPKKHLWEGVLEDIAEGVYEYGYQVKSGTWYSNPSPDPYARMTGEDGVSAFSVPREKPARLDSFDAQPLKDLILYRLNLDAFNMDFEGVTSRIDYYISQLGINGILFSPWIGYDRRSRGEKTPLHYFAPDDDYGTPYELKVMINKLHKAGIAVIMDIDLSAVSPAIAFSQLYPLFDRMPMMGRLNDNGKSVFFNYTDSDMGEFAWSVCKFWLEEYNIDGLRFINGRSFWDGADGDGLGALAKKIHHYREKEKREIFIFTDDCGTADQEVLNRSLVNGVSNSGFFKSIHRMTDNRRLDGQFWKTMDLNQLNFSDETVFEGKPAPNTALCSIEDEKTHSLVVKMGVLSGQRDIWGNPVGDRKNHWWKVKPYIISQFTGAGIPLIFNGQEIGENRFIPDQGPDRYQERPIRWQYLGDFAGRDLFRFHQKLIHMRNRFKSFKSRNFLHFFTDTDHQVMVFKRFLDDEQIVVAINFSNESCQVLMPFPADGYWQEYLDDYRIEVLNGKAEVKVPARYGVIFYRES